MTDTIRIFQFTDIHLFSDSKGELCGLNTADSLNLVVESARHNKQPPHLVLLTGDLSQDETAESYERLFELFQSLGVPVYCLPGNHDNPDLLSQILNRENVHSDRRILFDHWQIVLLNSVIVGKNEGFLSEEELSFLENCLKYSEDRFSMICLHHHPLPIGSIWMDTMMLVNTKEFLKTVDKFSRVKIVLNGHVHQEFLRDRNGVSFISTPSTCVQFMQSSSTFSIDEQPPGYRWLDLYADGSYRSGVVRVENFSYEPDLKSSGY
jgi:3',5'-cyclic-AMP phosphodiesterase